VTPDPKPIGEKAEYDCVDEDGLEQCPVCGTKLNPRFHSGAVVQPTGPTSAVVYEHLLETDPACEPFYCGECWEDHCQAEHARSHRSLSEFGTEDRVYYGE